MSDWILSDEGDEVRLRPGDRVHRQVGEIRIYIRVFGTVIAVLFTGYGQRGISIQRFNPGGPWEFVRTRNLDTRHTT